METAAQLQEGQKDNVVWGTGKVVVPAVQFERGFLLGQLKRIEKILPELLKCPDEWKTIDVTYHLPRVERVYIDHGEWRVSLHCIHPCLREEALYHPHPWPSAMRVLSGIYEMGTGYGKGKVLEHEVQVTELAAGSAYEMHHPDAWHDVIPLGEPCMTLMITGKPWDRITPRSNEKLGPLTEKRKKEIMDFFAEYYASGE